MKAAQLIDDFSPRSKLKVIRIRENHLRFRIAQLDRRDAFHRSGSTDRHKDRGLNFAMRRGEHASSGRSASGRYAKGNHALRVRGGTRRCPSLRFAESRITEVRLAIVPKSLSRIAQSQNA
jgi:hypothetical protein